MKIIISTDIKGKIYKFNQKESISIIKDDTSIISIEKGIIFKKRQTILVKKVSNSGIYKVVNIIGQNDNRIINPGDFFRGRLIENKSTTGALYLFNKYYSSYKWYRK